MNDLNTCDKCCCEENSLDLIWITAEDFNPKKREVLLPETYKKYDALCEECYLKVLI